MASGVITGRDVSTGTIIKNTSVGTFEQNCCYKINNVVTVSARIHSMSPQQQAFGVYFVLPVGFRPQATVYIMGSINIAGLFQSIPVVIQPNGNVEFNYSTGKTTDQVQFAGTFSL